MFEVKYQTPTRRKSTIDDSCPYYTDKRAKCSAADSSLSGEGKLKRPLPSQESSHWHAHENRRERRLNSMLKLRKEKLEEIT